jgi:endoglucanase
VQIHTKNGPVLGVIGRQPIHLLRGEERGKAPALSDMWIDIGASNKEEAQNLVPIGSVVTRAVQLEQLRGDLVVSRALDNKSGIFAIVEAMRRLHMQRDKLKASVVFVSAVQEEIGSRGARTGAYEVNPSIAIAVDVTFASDHPQTSKHELGDVRLNGGPGITNGGFVNPRVYDLLVAAANEAGIAYQLDLQGGATGTDIDVIQVARGGVATGLLNIPCRYMHTGSEIVSLKDIDDVAELMARFVLAVDEKTNLIP